MVLRERTVRLAETTEAALCEEALGAREVGMLRVPGEYQEFDDELRAGDYLKVVARQQVFGRRGLDKAFARIERVEHLTDPVGQSGKVRVVVFCHGMPGPMILSHGDHTVLEEVNPDRVVNDERNPWWKLDPKPLFYEAVFPGPRRPHRAHKADSDQDPVSWPSSDTAESAVRRAASFAKPTRALRVEDYLEVLAVRFPEHDRDPDEGFGRVDWVGYLDAEHSGRLCDVRWAGALVTVVAVRDLNGVLLLPEGEVRVMMWPNPERAACEQQQMSEPPADIAGVREPTEVERAEVNRLDEQLRPEPPAGEAELYPIMYTNEHERAMLFHSVYGIRAVPLTALPWSLGCKCEQPIEHIRAIAKTYPDNDHTASEAATAEAFGELTTADFATCRYHRADWAKINAIALEVAKSGAEGWEALEQIKSVKGDERLSDEDQRGIESLFMASIRWDDGDRDLTNVGTACARCGRLA